MGFSFFIKVSGMGKIRGQQMAAHLGGKVNPLSGYDDDVCIYVKQKPQGAIPKNVWMDVGDQLLYHRFILQHESCGIIAISRSHMEAMKEIYPRERIVLIPEHHCNFERRIKPRRKPLVAGVIGGWNSFQYSHERFSDMLRGIGLRWLFEPNFMSREDVLSFYEKIDVQVVYRPSVYRSELCNPLKLENAGSFGIPTVAFPEPSYESDFGGAFIPAYSVDEIVDKLYMLVRDEAYYDEWRSIAIEKAEDFHIEHIGELYKMLDEEHAEKDIDVYQKATLLQKTVVINGRSEKVYGLRSLRVRPREKGMGREILKGIEAVARRDGRYCIVAFCDPSILGFYESCGWFSNGLYDGKYHILTSVKVDSIKLEERW